MGEVRPQADGMFWRLTVPGHRPASVVAFVSRLILEDHVMLRMRAFCTLQLMSSHEAATSWPFTGCAEHGSSWMTPGLLDSARHGGHWLHRTRTVNRFACMR
jgi:hypothetical protein